MEMKRDTKDCDVRKVIMREFSITANACTKLLNRFREF